MDISAQQTADLLANLPKKWRQTAAQKFEKSVSYIEKVVAGKIENIEVFDYVAELAEQNKIAKDAKKAQIINRLKALAS